MSQELLEEVLEAAYEVMWYAKKIGGATDEGKQWSEVFREEVIALRDIAYAAGRSSMKEEAAKVCTRTKQNLGRDGWPVPLEAHEIADAIRALADSEDVRELAAEFAKEKGE